MSNRVSPLRAEQHYLKLAESRIGRFNSKLAVFITRKVGRMETAYIFVGVTALGFPGLLGPNALPYLLWGSTIFLQLVLLPIIIVGQNVQASAADARAAATYNDVELMLTRLDDIQTLLKARVV